jgi:hypothetical protein
MDIEYLCLNSKIYEGTVLLLFGPGKSTDVTKPVIGVHHDDVVEWHLDQGVSILPILPTNPTWYFTFTI